jgi:hypothetical protein
MLKNIASIFLVVVLLEHGVKCQNPCAKLACLNGGTCIPVNSNVAACNCASGFSGKFSFILYNGLTDLETCFKIIFYYCSIIM